MEGEIEKIVCCDRGGNDNAMAAAILASANNRGYYRDNNDALYALLANQRNNDPMAMAAMMNNGMNNPMTAMAMMNGGNGMWNNPFIYLVWMMYAQRMWGNGNGWGDSNGQGIEIQNQLQAIRSQMQDNQNTNAIMDAVKGNGCQIGQLAQNLNCDFNTLNAAICDVRSAIQQVAGQVGLTGERVINAVERGEASTIQAVQNCCCNIRESIANFRADMQLQMCQQTGELRNGQRDIAAAVTQGFASTAFQAQQDKCDILRAGENNTQRIVDLLNNHWSAEDKLKIQDLKFELSQERQNRYIANVVNGGCGCGCGTGNMGNGGF